MSPIKKTARQRKRSKTLLGSAIVVTAAMVPLHLFAFAPGGFKSFPFAKTHAEITEESLELFYRELGINDVTKSMKEARNQMVEANKEVDLNQTDSALHFDGENFSGGQRRVINLMSLAVTQLKQGDAEGARRSVGGALHSIQDFYSHTNWVELGNALPSGELGRAGQTISNTAPADIATCVDAPVGNSCFKGNLLSTFLTSGYYSGEGRDRPIGKCRHGGFFDESPGSGGINKDSAICTGTNAPLLLDSPHNDSNGAAAEVAFSATLQFYRDIQRKVSEREFKALLGVGPALAFAIDTTGSMGPIIAGVQASANGIVNARLGTQAEASKYVLSPFNDPVTGPVTTTSDPTAFKRAINSLSASGGGDCPELAMRGTLDAIAASEDGSDVFVFTDASAKDAALAGSVLALAAQKDTRLNFSLFGNCSPYDPAYFFLANNTGGQVFILKAGEAAAVTGLADVVAQNRATNLFVANDAVVRGTPKTYAIPVDSQTSKVNFVFSSTSLNANVAIVRPDGITVGATDTGVKTINLSQSKVVSISAPQAGRWSVMVGGEGDFSLVTTGESTLSLDGFQFVEVGGRPGHQGYFPISGLPAPGKKLKARAQVSGNPSDLSFEFRDTNSGSTISSFTLSDDNAETGSMVGDVTIPAQSFRTYAVGRDARGMPFQRVMGVAVAPSPIAIMAPVSVELSQGQTTTYIFQIRNDGASDSFRFTALDSAKFVTGVSPASATLATGATANVRVTLQTASSAVVGVPDTLTFTAVSTTKPGVSNFAVLRSAVRGPFSLGDVNRDGTVDCDDLAVVRASFGSKVGKAAFNPNVDLDANGVVDVRDLAIVTRQVPAGTVCK